MLCALLLSSCAQPEAQAEPTLTVAAAANLTGVMDEVAAAFRARTGIDVVLSYGSTAQLAQQIGNGAPFDLFAAADSAHVDELVNKGLVAANSRAIYAKGQLALWLPEGEKLGVRGMNDLVRPGVRFVAIAQPALAPYGEAALEAMRSAGLWEKLEPKLVYANNINMAKQYAATGNADAAFTALSLVLKAPGVVVKVDPKFYRPIEQALGVVSASKQTDQARQFAAFLLGGEGRAILQNGGYLAP